jgi:cytosine deaminase
MDSTLSYGLPRVNASGTLLEGIALWGELKPTLTTDAIVERALRYCDWAVGKGLLAIRSHVDVCDPRLMAVDALLDVRKRVAPYLDLQLVAFPQDGLLRSEGAQANLERALDKGVDVVGGIPHFERTMAEGAESVRMLCGIAAARGLRVDMHCDETDDPMSRHIESLARETLRHGLAGRVAGSHLTSMHSMDNYYVSKLIPLIAEARVAAIANPLINITIQGRHDTYPKRRGMTRVPELMAAGIDVALGHDCVLDPWYPLGSADMLEGRAHGAARRADDRRRGDEGLLRCGDERSCEDPGPRGLRHRAGLSRRLRAPRGARCRRGDTRAGDSACRRASWQDRCADALRGDCARLPGRPATTRYRMGQ